MCTTQKTKNHCMRTAEAELRARDPDPRQPEVATPLVMPMCVQRTTTETEDMHWGRGTVTACNQMHEADGAPPQQHGHRGVSLEKDHGIKCAWESSRVCPTFGEDACGGELWLNDRCSENRGSPPCSRQKQKDASWERAPAVRDARRKIKRVMVERFRQQGIGGDR